MSLEKSHGVCHIRSESRRLLPLHQFSAIILGNKYVLVPGAIIASCDDIIGANLLRACKEQLRTFEIIDATSDIKWKRLREIKFYVKHSPNDILIEVAANFLYAFNCKAISQSINNILTGFNIKTEDNIDDSTFKHLLSCFVVLQICGTDEHSTIKEDFLSHEQQIFQKLDSVGMCSTPFGNTSFFATINYGHISNILGIDDSLMIISTTLVNGCEGAGVFDRNKKLIGVVLKTTFIWNNENANLSLVGSYHAIVDELLKQLKIKARISNYNHSKAVPFAEKFTVYIEHRSSWGTGCFIKIKSKKFVITCAHVIANSNIGDKIHCVWKNGSFDAKVLFLNPHYNQPFDLALLEAPTTIPEDVFTVCSQSIPRVGQEIVSIGFPQLRSLALHKFSPSIFKGRIIKYTTGMIFTDVSIQAGQSGGPLFNEHYELIGVFVSNTKDIENNVIYPNLNLAVPICDVFVPLLEFAVSGDLRSLDGLIAGKEIKRLWSLQEPIVNSRL